MHLSAAGFLTEMKRLMGLTLSDAHVMATESPRKLENTLTACGRKLVASAEFQLGVLLAYHEVHVLGAQELSERIKTLGDHDVMLLASAVLQATAHRDGTVTSKGGAKDELLTLARGNELASLGADVGKVVDEALERTLSIIAAMEKTN
jgi:hypothetical protein